MNKRLAKLIETHELKDGDWLDCYNNTTSEIAGTITSIVNDNNMFFIAENETNNDSWQSASTRKQAND